MATLASFSAKTWYLFGTLLSGGLMLVIPVLYLIVFSSMRRKNENHDFVFWVCLLLWVVAIAGLVYCASIYFQSEM